MTTCWQKAMADQAVSPYTGHLKTDQQCVNTTCFLLLSIPSNLPQCQTVVLHCASNIVMYILTYLQCLAPFPSSQLMIPPATHQALHKSSRVLGPFLLSAPWPMAGSQVAKRPSPNPWRHGWQQPVPMGQQKGFTTKLQESDSPGLHMNNC